MLSLIQKHTIDIYNLTQKRYRIEKVKARDLLSVYRFDLFAKLYYIRNRYKDEKQALKVYIQHIMAFNPDMKEPGRKDKNSISDFISAFDCLISCFEQYDFDDSLSLVPVSEDGVILDGAHRVAALAFYNKEITIVRFYDVRPKCRFDYNYFLKRGLSFDIANIIAEELLKWKSNVYAACLYFEIGKNKNRVASHIGESYPICYEKIWKMHLKVFVTFINYVCKNELCVRGGAEVKDKSIQIFKPNSSIYFVFFQTDSSEEVFALKEKIKNLYPCEKHFVYVTDNIEKTRNVAYFVLNKKGVQQWLGHSLNFRLLQCKEYINEKFFFIKNVQWLKLKIFVSGLLHKMKLI